MSEGRKGDDTATALQAAHLSSTEATESKMAKTKRTQIRDREILLFFSIFFSLPRLSILV